MLAVGRFRPGSPEAALFAQYAARLRPPLGLIEIAEGRGASQAEVRRREGEATLAALPAGALLVALDPRGTVTGSEALAASLARWEAAGRALAFAIGGAAGLDSTVLTRAEHRLSLGPMIWPHLLVRAMLAEQLYRARCIRAGHPYHRTAPPE